jgi:hypothetical protein
MSEIPQHEPHRRPHAGPMAAPFLEFDLPAEIHRLRAETTWSTGHNTRTLAKYDDFRVVLIALRATVRIFEPEMEVKAPSGFEPDGRSCRQGRSR